ncbi:MAG: hypothetical protein AB2689_06050 [Candidatus Thiodiazotropha taylori]
MREFFLGLVVATAFTIAFVFEISPKLELLLAVTGVAAAFPLIVNLSRKSRITKYDRPAGTNKRVVHKA